MTQPTCYYRKQHTDEIRAYLVYQTMESVEPHLWVVGAYTLDILHLTSYRSTPDDLRAANGRLASVCVDPGGRHRIWQLGRG
jgi:hypothetical protein